MDIRDKKIEITFGEYDNLIGSLGKQNDFILKMFNDKRIPDEAKEEYFIKYNELKVRLSLDDK